MTQPKLTAAQQRVYDWLGESAMRTMHTINGRHSRAYLTDRGIKVDQSSVQFNVRSDILFRLTTHLHETQRKVYGSRYIHPKFAGGKHE